MKEDDYPPVTVYTMPGCYACKRVIKKLADAEVWFEVVDIGANSDALSYVKNVLGAQSVPVIQDKDYEVIYGYQPDLLTKLIAKYSA